MDPLPLWKVLPHERSSNACASSITPSSRARITFNQIGKYKVKKVLGKGAYGEVFLAVDRNKRKVAIKKMRKEACMYTTVVQETDFTERLKAHHFCVKFVDKVENSDHIYLVLKYEEGGDLYEKIFPENFRERGLPGCLPEKEALSIFCKLALGIQHIHSKGVVHADLKLENILLNASGDPIIADFGLSKSFDPSVFCKYAPGTLHYAAPETFRRIPIVGTEVDVWSLGIILYIMLFGRYPFFGKTKEDIVSSICWDSLKFRSSAVPISDASLDLLSKLLVKLPGKRITVDSILAHSALSNVLDDTLEYMRLHPVAEEDVQPFQRFEKVLRAFTPSKPTRLPSDQKSNSPVLVRC